MQLFTAILMYQLNHTEVRLNRKREFLTTEIRMVSVWLP
jgi:hypothetical protein